VIRRRGQAEESIGIDMMGYLMDLPLLSIFQFQEESLPMPADALVEGLLAQVATEGQRSSSIHG
jgi:hypothetical protein